MPAPARALGVAPHPAIRLPPLAHERTRPPVQAPKVVTGPGTGLGAAQLMWDDAMQAYRVWPGAWRGGRGWARLWAHARVRAGGTVRPGGPCCEAWGVGAGVEEGRARGRGSGRLAGLGSACPPCRPCRPSSASLQPRPVGAAALQPKWALAPAVAAALPSHPRLPPSCASWASCLMPHASRSCTCAAWLPTRAHTVHTLSPSLTRAHTHMCTRDTAVAVFCTCRRGRACDVCAARLEAGGASALRHQPVRPLRD